MTNPHLVARLAGVALVGAAGALAATTAGASARPAHVRTRAPRRADRASRSRQVGARRVARRTSSTTASALAGLVQGATRGTANAVVFDLGTTARRATTSHGSPVRAAGSTPAPSATPSPTASTSQTSAALVAGGASSGGSSTGTPSGAAGSSTGVSGGSAAGSSGTGTTAGGAPSTGGGALATSSGPAPAPPPGFSASQLIFSSTFSGSTLNTSKWNTYMTSKAANGYPWAAGPGGGSALGSTYADYDVPSAVSVHGGLDLHASAGSSQPGYSWTSGVVTTYGHFEFDGGYLQVRAKMPTANGDWPAIWMLPGPGANTSTDNFEIDLFEGGSTWPGPASGTYAYHVHMNNSTTWGTADATGVDLAAGYHTYGLDWVPGKSVTWYFDGRQVAQVTSAQFTIPNEPMEIILNNGMANSSTSSWHTTVDGSTGSSSDMLVSSVQVYQ